MFQDWTTADWLQLAGILVTVGVPLLTAAGAGLKMLAKGVKHLAVIEASLSNLHSGMEDLRDWKTSHRIEHEQLAGVVGEHGVRLKEHAETLRVHGSLILRD